MLDAAIRQGRKSAMPIVPPLPPTDPQPPPPPPRRGNPWSDAFWNWRWFTIDPFNVLNRRRPSPPGSRNWRFVAIGCFSVVVLGVLIVLGGVGFMSVVTGVERSSEPHKSAVARAKADHRVTAALGTPISEGSSFGKTTVVNGSGEADLTIPISGPKGKGTIYVVATKSAGDWTYSKLLVKVDATGETIDLGP